MDGQNFNNNEQNPYGQYSAGSNSGNYDTNNYYQDNTNNNNQSVYQNYTNNSETIPPYQEPYQSQPQKQENNGLAIVGLVMGIISILFTCCYGGGILFGIIGWVCSAMANKQNKTGIGKAGLITSIIGTILSILMLILIIVVFVIMGFSTDWYY
jgi:hypothetical protein